MGDPASYEPTAKNDIDHDSHDGPNLWDEEVRNQPTLNELPFAGVDVKGAEDMGHRPERSCRREQDQEVLVLRERELDCKEVEAGSRWHRSSRGDRGWPHLNEHIGEEAGEENEDNRNKG